MKILLVTDHYPPEKLGGIPYIVENLQKALSAKGHQTIVLTTGDNTYSQDNIYRSHKNLLLGSLINNIIILRWVLKKEIDIIHLHQPLSTLFLLFFPFFRIIGITVPKVINSFQVDYIQEFRNVKKIQIRGKTIYPQRQEYIEKYLKYPLHILIDLVGYYLVDVITTVSYQNKEELLQHYGFLYKKEILYIPNGIDLKKFKLKKTIFKPECLKMLYVGAFRVRKRIFHMIELIRLLKYEYKLNICLNIIGAGRKGYENNIKEMIEDYNLEKEINLVGYVENKRLGFYINDSHIFLIISSYEGMSVAMLEALGNGKIVVSTELYGAKEVIKDFNTGILVQLDDLNEMAKKINYLYHNPKLFSIISENVLTHIRENYSYEKVSNKYLNCYENILS